MSPIPGPFPPNSDLVAQTWIGTRVPGIAAAQVAGSLPAVSSWLEEGFVTVASIPGTRPDVELPVRHPIVQVDCWGASGTSTAKPHWPKAYRLAELIRLATEGGQVYGQPLDLDFATVDYLPVRVQAVYLVSEPSKVDGDPSGYGRVTFDLAIDWVPVAP